MSKDPLKKGDRMLVTYNDDYKRFTIHNSDETVFVKNQKVYEIEIVSVNIVDVRIRSDE